MNKKFFNGMLNFATIFTCLGIIVTIAVFITTSFVFEIYSPLFNPAGLLYTAIALFTVVTGYYIIKGIALIGLKVYENEVETKESIPREKPKNIL